MSDAVYDAHSPPAWEARSWGAATLGMWFGGLLQRAAQYQAWVDYGRQASFCLTALFNPQVLQK